MAKYIGYMPVLGTIGNLTFARGENGEVVVKQRTSMSGERIHHDAGFKRTREVMAEFGRAGKAGSLILKAAREVVLSKADKRTMGRLVKTGMSIIASDTVNIPGMRNLTDGDLSLFRDFQFNRKTSVDTSFYGSYAGSIARITGLVEMTVPSFIPEEMVVKPEAATHFRLVTGGMELDFNARTYTRDKAMSAWIPWGLTATAPLTLSCNLTPNSTLPLFQLFGIEYAKEKNGVKYALEDGAFNAAGITGVDVVA
jgi:hypothetical protein